MYDERREEVRQEVRNAIDFCCLFAINTAFCLLPKQSEDQPAVRDTSTRYEEMHIIPSLKKKSMPHLR